jgi:hypothetical protein
MLWMVTLIPHEAYAGVADVTDGCDHHVNSTYFQLLPDSRLFSSSWLQMCMFFFAERPAVKTQLMTI